MHRMKRVTCAAVTLALASAMAGQSSAQDEPVGYGEAFAALEASTLLDLDNIEAEATVDIVPMSEVEPTNGANAEAFAKMREGHAAALEDVRQQVRNNEKITSALKAEGYTADQVVAVWNDADKEVTVFVEEM
ncbi:hypothetical protein NTH_00917 [Nitratireductor thuwali]|uniref:DUF4142 domain-containing protein n=2 Tax=Nitratireductor thuwali TaxID=2267699 RepID=A0ABY5MEK2_9HYPH|nr:hypothetical protein NTH_00917 [Nitratireductor thuwali]